MKIYELMVLCWLFGGDVCEEADLEEETMSKLEFRELEPMLAEIAATPKIIPSGTDVQPKPTTDCVPPILDNAHFLFDCE